MKPNDTWTGGELPGLDRLRSGKVREIFVHGDRLLLAATDRVSAFDVVLRDPIPGKGRILTALSAFWFERTRHIVPNHLLGTDVDSIPGLPKETRERLAGRTLVVRRADVLPYEFVVRGYLSGSGFASYRETGEVCGVRLPRGLVEASALPEPILTPTTKAEHDEPVTFDDVVGDLGAPVARRARDAALALYRFAAAAANSAGVLLADTKFEFGIVEGELLLVDECLTPDSSRFWPAEEYSPGRAQRSFDKQVLRDYLVSTGWTRRPPPPRLPPEVIEKTAAAYREIARRLTGAEP
jgi:phosphoribosylaminoimidazole-succinocarboxamide synthase